MRTIYQFLGFLTKPLGLERHHTTDEMGTWDGKMFTYYRQVRGCWIVYGGTDCHPRKRI